MSSIKAPSGIDATIVITTKDRKEDLRTAVQSAINQTANVEVLVIDDGSSDETSAMIREEFPQVRLHREQESAGLIVRRNQAAEMARGDIIFSIDDDAEFSSPYVVEETLQEFSEDCIGAVAIPYVDVRKGSDIKQRAPGDDRPYCTSAYRGTAHALRRDLFLELRGYREHFFHQGEEGDYCLRLLNAGYVVRLGDADVIKHYESPQRDLQRMAYYGRRNEVLFLWHNAPGWHLPLHLVRTALNAFRTAARNGRLQDHLKGLLAGSRDCVWYLDDRSPVEPGAFRLFRRLQRNGPIPLAEIRDRLAGWKNLSQSRGA